MTLVIGATGHVGRQVVAQLASAGAFVRALARDPAAADLPAGVDVVRGDLLRPETLEPALRGVDAVFLVWPFRTTDAAPAMLDVIAR
ncbi:MAG TPA: NAD(P)H-binding protein, partial [Jatrophihabitantaceae bacterium]|nr:NAD(P)H-binding protein [Jatrophihabitantaceae bacterium]